jgi:hypothetical protein
MLVGATGSLLGVHNCIGLLFAFDSSLVFTTVTVGIMTALEEYLKLEDAIFNDMILLCTFDLVSLQLDTENLFYGSASLGISR